MVTNILTAVVTAYVATGHCVAYNKPNAHLPVVGFTIALPRRFALGSSVEVTGADGVLRRYHGEDRTAKKYDGRFDIFVDTREHALAWGRQTLKVTVITP